MSKLVIVESPYAGETPMAIGANLKYARRACLNCIDNGETPFASHLFYPQMLNDDDEIQRDLGIKFGYEIGGAFSIAADACHNTYQCLVAFYVDLGWSQGMEQALAHYTELGLPCEIRRLPTETKPGT